MNISRGRASAAAGVLAAVWAVAQVRPLKLIVQWFAIGSGCTLVGLLFAVVYVYKPFSAVAAGRPGQVPRPGVLYRGLRFPAYAFAAPARWPSEAAALQGRGAARPPLYPPSFVVSSSLDLVLEYVLRDFVLSWYGSIEAGAAADAAFPAEVDAVLRHVVGQLLERVLKLDLADVIVRRLVPVFTKHLSDFGRAETELRGKHLTRQFTESRELDIALAAKYNGGELHPAAALRSPDPKLAEKTWVRKVVAAVVPHLLPDADAQSRATVILLEELVGSAVLLPVLAELEEPDTWNSLLEGYASRTLQDRKAVQRLRAALDKHAQPAAAAKARGPAAIRLTPRTDERTYERYVRSIRRCTLLSEARRCRYDLAVQLRKATKTNAPDALYVNRLRNAKRLIDVKVLELSSESLTPSKRARARLAHAAATADDPRERYSVQQILQSASGLSYFMEYMDRQHRTVLIQFYLVVDGFKNPLEEGNDSEPDDSDDDRALDEKRPLASAELPAATWTDADAEDIRLIFHSYFGDPVLGLPRKYRAAVEAFVATENPSPDEYRRARHAILRAQKHTLGQLETDLDGYRRSDIFLKYLTSADAEPDRGTVEDYHSLEDDSVLDDGVAADDDGLQTAVQPEDDVVKAVQAAFDDIMHRPDDGSETFSVQASSPRSSIDSSRPTLDADGLSVVTRTSTAASVVSTAASVAPSTAASTAASVAPSVVPSGTSTASGASTASVSPSVASLPALAPTTTAASALSALSDDAASHVSRLRSDLFGTGGDDSSSIFPSESALFDEVSHDFSDDSMSLSSGSDTEPFADVHDSVQRAAPGDLGLTEAIQQISADIDTLTSQDAVLTSLLHKAELTNNVADLRILRKSKASVEREIRRKELQRQQYMVQETDNSLYGRSRVRIQSALTLADKNGTDYTLYVIEVQRLGYDSAVTAGWIVTRRYSEFYRLHQHLRRKYPAVKTLDFPKKGVNVLKMSRAFADARQAGLERYLKALITIPEVCGSRELRSFLSSAKTADLGDQPPRRDLRGAGSQLANKLVSSISDGMEDIFGNIIFDYGANILPGAGSTPRTPRTPSTPAESARAPSRQTDADSVRSRRSSRHASGGSDSAANTSSSSLSRLAGPFDDTDERARQGRKAVQVPLQQLRTTGLFENSPDVGSSVFTKRLLQQQQLQVQQRLSADAAQPADESERKAIAEVQAELNSFEADAGASAPFIKPICDLFLEIFDLNKGNNWLRDRASVVVLQQLLGGTIERKVRDQIDLLAEEETAIALLQTVRDKIWPGGQRPDRDDPANQPKPRSAKDVAKTKTEAAFLLNTLLQDMAAKVVGSGSARHASRRLFAMLQNRILNVHLIASVVDELLCELFPEARGQILAR
ncbi:PXA domain-containing protein [Dipodascopsis tothii]|uniref:PXA domain-containing protein n=1 Tax=Dipodascopsis tothii TaxID=44089 RepID=UPI0034CDF80E